jgi:hypothetical protein
MNLTKTLLAGVLALATVAAASAQTRIYITGSTAFRFGTVQGLIDLYSGGSTATSTGDAHGANACTFSGGTFPGIAGTTTIKCSWSGSEGGVQTVGATSPTFNVQFLPDSATGTNNPDPRSTTVSSLFEAARPDVALSDVFQASTPFNGTYNGVTYDAMPENKVGIITFVWAASKNFPLNGGTAPFSNYSMTQGIAQTLFTGGNVPLAFFTGSSSDDNTAVIATGRDYDSGTRGTAVTEGGIGATTLLRQYQPINISGTTINDVQLYPLTTINGVPSVQPGNGGESSGSTLRTFMTYTLAQSAVNDVDDTYVGGGYLLTYLGVSDFNTVSGSGAVQLLWDSNRFSQTACIEGRYTFWGYEHLYIRTTSSSTVSGFASTLSSHIQGESDAELAPNISYGSLNAKVFRSADGAPIKSQLH